MYSDSAKYSDELLLRLVQQDDDQAAFAELYSRYWEHLLDVGFQRLKSVEAAEEVVQEVFVQLYTRRKQITLVSSLTAYLNAALKYHVFNLYRSQQIHHKYMETCLQDSFVSQQTPYDQLNYKELNEKIQGATMLMPQKCREVFFLSRYEHLPQQAIASRLGIALSTVKKHLTKALRILRAELYRRDLFIVVLAIQLYSGY